MLPTDVTEEDQDLALAFGRDLSVHPESIRWRELREERLRELGFEDVTTEQREANMTITELDRLLHR